MDRSGVGRQKWEQRVTQTLMIARDASSLFPEVRAPVDAAYVVEGLLFVWFIWGATFPGTWSDCAQLMVVFRHLGTA